jgi:hypothetical protein
MIPVLPSRFMSPLDTRFNRLCKLRQHFANLTPHILELNKDLNYLRQEALATLMQEVRSSGNHWGLAIILGVLGIGSRITGNHTQEVADMENQKTP